MWRLCLTDSVSQSQDLYTLSGFTTMPCHAWTFSESRQFDTLSERRPFLQCALSHHRLWDPLESLTSTKVLSLSRTRTLWESCATQWR